MKSHRKKLIQTAIMAVILLLFPSSILAGTKESLPVKTCTISGKVSFPKGLKAAKDVHFTIMFTKDDSQSSFINAKDLKISAGSNSVMYKLEVPPDSEGYVRYRYEADENIFCYNGYYSKKETTFAFSKSTKLKMQGKNKSNIDLQFIKGKKLGGKVSIPYTYDNAAFNYYCNIIPIYDNGTPNNLNDDIQIAQSYYNHAEFDIHGKHNKEAAYSVIVPDIEAMYKFKYQLEFGSPCFGGCPFVREGYYKKSGAVASYSKADSVMIKGPGNKLVDFSILKARKIQGEVILPDGIKAESDMGILLLNDEDDREAYVTFDKGAGSADFTLYFQGWTGKHIILLGYNNVMYYVSKNSIVKDRASARLFDLSKGNLDKVNIYLPENIVGHPR
jgi:hypothetical protein